ncbi:MAG TPA: hypothetical protein VEP49_19335 [Acidimicrobiia bacterium]|nr:hypothetical protein [Acidimicrobiia bacterium]
MAFVVARPGGRFEVRESRATPDGPRARTLATFTTLDDAALAHVIERAEKPVDVRLLVHAARRAGAPVTVGASPADAAARALLAELRAGHRPSAPLAAALAAAVEPEVEVSDAVRSAAAWSGATLEERGDALRDLLLLADRLPVPRRRR